MDLDLLPRMFSGLHRGEYPKTIGRSRYVLVGHRKAEHVLVLVAYFNFPSHNEDEFNSNFSGGGEQVLRYDFV